MKTAPRISQTPTNDSPAWRIVLSGVRGLIHRGWHILREVLRGYCAGPSPDDERPRKGCC